MSVTNDEGRTVHYPNNPEAFAFDAEVASLFDDMAKRSIPMYDEVHRMHVSMLRDRLVPGAVVVDVGSSTGRLFREIESFSSLSIPKQRLHCTAIDSSAPMMDRLQARFPYVDTIVGALPTLEPLREKADIIFCLYTMQFVAPESRELCMQWFFDNLKPTGIIVFGQKDSVHGAVSPLFSEEYYRMRRANGYTQEEIDAKTKALKGSMWPVHEDVRKQEAWHSGFYTVVETSRWLEFTTSMVSRYRSRNV